MAEVPTTPSFPNVKRGYDPTAVDAHLDELTEFIAVLRFEFEDARAEIRKLKRDLSNVRSAEEEATRAYIAGSDAKQKLIDEGTKRAGVIVREARDLAAEVIADAEAKAAGVEADAQQSMATARDLLEAAKRDAEATLAGARREALQVLAEAERSAEMPDAQHADILRKLQQLHAELGSVLHSNGTEAAQPEREPSPAT